MQARDRGADIDRCDVITNRRAAFEVNEVLLPLNVTRWFEILRRLDNFHQEERASASAEADPLDRALFKLFDGRNSKSTLMATNS